MKKIINNKIVKNLFRVLKIISTILIIIVVSIIFLQRVTNNNFAIGGIRIFTVITGSMKPAYEVGDMIFAHEIKPKDINVGDDVVYKGKEGDFKDKVVMHRVINKELKNGKYSFQTQGIANTGIDPVITGDQVYGSVVYKSVILSFLSKILNNNFGFYFLIFIPLVAIIVFEIIDTLRDRGEKKEEII